MQLCQYKEHSVIHSAFSTITNAPSILRYRHHILSLVTFYFQKKRIITRKLLTCWTSATDTGDSSTTANHGTRSFGGSVQAYPGCLFTALVAEVQKQHINAGTGQAKKPAINLPFAAYNLGNIRDAANKVWLLLAERIGTWLHRVFCSNSNDFSLQSWHNSSQTINQSHSALHEGK